MKKNKYVRRIKRRFKKYEEDNYDLYQFSYSKILIIIVLLIVFFKEYIKQRDKGTAEKEEIVQIPENIDPSSLSPNEHYKILFPKIKYHNYKRISPEDEINLFKLEDSSDYQKMKETGKDNYIYYSCVITKAKHENLYVREFVEHYLNLGIEKFYFGDDNEENIENLSDILDDYIKKGIVDVEYIFYRNMSHWDFFEYTFRAVKLRCKWFLLFDMDEFLEFTDKNMTIKTYLDMPVFDKCDAIKIHWMIFDDNNLIYYDNRTLKERFSHPLTINKLNSFHKSILRGKNYSGSLFTKLDHVHQPNENFTTQCDALGNIEKLRKGILGRPKFKYCFIRHHTYKTAEEFAVKLIRGRHRGVKYELDKILDYFFKVNKLTEEKIQLIEHIINKTFPKYHK